MNQRLKTNQNIDTTSCETYMAKMLKRELNNMQAMKNTIPICCQKRSTSIPRQQQNYNNVVSKLRTNTTTTNNNKQISMFNKTSPSAQQSATINNYIHKEMINTDNSALVEVTVKTTKAKQRTVNSNIEQREPWSELLNSNRSRENIPSSFGNFDPLRTLHFLVQELEMKVKDSLSDDNNVKQMLYDIQHALRRIPPEVASIIHSKQSNDTVPVINNKNSNSDFFPKDDKPEKLINVLNPEKVNFIGECSEDLQKKIEENRWKLDAACKQFEMNCKSLQNENERLEFELKIEKDNARYHEERANGLDLEIKELMTVKLKHLENEVEKLESEIKKLKNESKSNNLDLENKIKNLKFEKTNLQNENVKLKNQITILNMEKEKYIAMVQIRDREIDQIQCEVVQIQKEFGNELIQYNNTVSDKNIGDVSTISSVNSSESLKKLPLKELPDGNNEIISKLNSNNENNIKESDNSTQIEEVWKEL